MGDGINIFTFYSYKGGVGRSKALANVGAQLARWGYKTLMIDWDLEAPGLEDYFDKYFRRDWDAKSQEGLIDILHPIFKGTQNPEDVSNSWENKLINIPLEKDPSIGNLYLLSAGKRDEHYFNKVRELDFKDFYKNKSGGEVIEKFRDSLKDKFDFILIDSRTGNTDVGNICTAQMPDILVVLFTAMNASVEGVINTALRANRNRASLPVERFKMPILPIPTRMDLTERTKRDSWLSTFATRFKDLIEEWLEVEEHFNPNEVPEATEFEEGFEDREKHIESHKNDFVRSQLKNYSHILFCD